MYIRTFVSVCVCARVHRALLRVHRTRFRLHRSFCGYVRLFCGYLSARLWTPSTATRISTVARVPERRWQSWIRWHFQWRCQRYRRQKSRASRRTCPEETCPEPQLKSTWPCLCTHTPTPKLSALSSAETAGIEANASSSDAPRATIEIDVTVTAICFVICYTATMCCTAQSHKLRHWITNSTYGSAEYNTFLASPYDDVLIFGFTNSIYQEPRLDVRSHNRSPGPCARQFRLWRLM